MVEEIKQVTSSIEDVHIEALTQVDEKQRQHVELGVNQGMESNEYIRNI